MASALPPSRPIVLIDDSPDDLVFTRRLIDKARIRNPILSFLSGEDALAHLTARARTGAESVDALPAIVFVDAKMPKLDGFTLVQFLRKEKRFASIKIVVLTDSHEVRDHERATRLGADHYLTKFPAPEVFAEMIATAGRPAAA
jgi:two-component system, response regulator